MTEPIQKSPDFTVHLIAPDHLLRVNDPTGAVMVEVDFDGTVTFGEGYEPEDGARRFWEAMGKAGWLAWAAARAEAKAAVERGDITVSAA